ncbi:hypothetical protein DFH06DRAFT_1300178, partial [Mycena polygramma]
MAERAARSADTDREKRKASRMDRKVKKDAKSNARESLENEQNDSEVSIQMMCQTKSGPNFLARSASGISPRWRSTQREALCAQLDKKITKREGLCAQELELAPEGWNRVCIQSMHQIESALGVRARSASRLPPMSERKAQRALCMASMNLSLALHGRREEQVCSAKQEDFVLNGVILNLAVSGSKFGGGYRLQRSVPARREDWRRFHRRQPRANKVAPPQTRVPTMRAKIRTLDVAESSVVGRQYLSSSSEMRVESLRCPLAASAVAARMFESTKHKTSSLGLMGWRLRRRGGQEEGASVVVVQTLQGRRPKIADAGKPPNRLERQFLRESYSTSSVRRMCKFDE